mmetsp:Transcript_14748/g.50776  ORF Transcript_14748/g.50776 Transcript_14748/m.50776 type:complete len:226 (+) Transcript_14748:542-1219(+)
MLNEANSMPSLFKRSVTVRANLHFGSAGVPFMKSIAGADAMSCCSRRSRAASALSCGGASLLANSESAAASLVGSAPSTFAKTFFSEWRSTTVGTTSTSKVSAYADASASSFKHLTPGNCLASSHKSCSTGLAGSHQSAWKSTANRDPPTASAAPKSSTPTSHTPIRRRRPWRTCARTRSRRTRCAGSQSARATTQTAGPRTASGRRTCCPRRSSPPRVWRASAA